MDNHHPARDGGRFARIGDMLALLHALEIIHGRREDRARKDLEKAIERGGPTLGAECDHERCREISAAVRDLRAEIAEIVNEIECCDDVVLSNGLAAAIADLRQQRDDARANQEIAA